MEHYKCYTSGDWHQNERLGFACNGEWFWLLNRLQSSVWIQ